MEQTKSRVRIRLNGNIIDEFEVNLKLQERHHCEYIISDVHRRQPKIRNLNLSDVDVFCNFDGQWIMVLYYYNAEKDNYE